MISEFRIAARSLLKSPSFAAATVLTLALGIGACTALFSVINSLLYRPTPLRDVDRVVFALARHEGDAFLTAPAEYEAWRDGASSTISWGAALHETMVLSGLGEPEQLAVGFIDGGYLPTLGVAPTLGREFTPEEIAANAPRLLLGHAFWRARLAADPAIIGRTLVLDGVPHTVTGVLPPGFDLPRSNQVYRPYRIPPPGTPERPDRGIFPIARLKPGRSLAEADTELKAISARLALAEPAQKGWSVNLIPQRHQLLLDIQGRLNRRLLLLSGAVLLLLLVACANVGNLVLARTLARTRELAICAALGAGRGRLMRRLLAENTLLALAGGAGGLLLALWLTPLLAAGSPVETVALTGILTQPSFDGRVLAVSMLLVFAAITLGALPALWSMGRLDLIATLQSGARGSSGGGGRWRDGLIVLQVAFCLALLAGAALLGKSFTRLLAEPLGFDPRGVLSVRVSPAPQRYPDQAARHRLAESILERVRSLPGVKAAGVVTTLPFHLDGWSSAYRAETGPTATSENPPGTAHRLVTPGYLEAMGMTLRQGRFINAHDRADTTPVAVISETFAQRTWPGEDPLGKRLRRPREPDRWITVVGVVAAVKEDRELGIRNEGAVWYLPYAQQNLVNPFHVVLKTEGDPALLSRAVATEVARIDPLQPTYEAIELEPYVTAFMAPERFAASLLGSFALVGLALAAVGIYGLSSYFVALRQRELGIRLALGATPAGVQRLVVGHSFRLLAAGALLGLLASIALGRFFGSLLHEVPPYDPAVYGIVLMLLVTVTALATWLPARRAARVDPLVSLRAE